MKLGLTLPSGGADVSPESLGQMAEEAERIGLASVWTFERLLNPVDGATPIGGGDAVPLPESYGSVFDPLATLAYLAARTTSITLGTCVLDAVLHSPVVLARRLATVDRLSGGRLLAGLGVGWMVQEYEASGVPEAQRGPRLGEHIRAMRKVWGPDPVEHTGRFYTIAPSYAGPKPVRPEGVRLLAGSMAPAAIERAARLGVGLIPIIMTWEMFDAGVATFRAAAEKAGHDTLPIIVKVNGTVTASSSDARGPLTGGVEQVLEDLERLRGAGIDHVVWTMDTDPADQLGVLADLLRKLSS
ncbi:TIGR03619 family F420-dependent LLM class oxidoreductase [Kribbella turkmenica]|uniref:TIGR03619 family F420-dependent LLM class oxidoreductase n=1 Tax=Kribbella turkmenica TaxID=2530375 RepID=A0A4R4WYJ4_9ACTN|nr:TIGR03619 family F420-dependent LLM class oxidoreductase [Kribbella turkmenica]TDD22916.1 TIGR03619 family F420-dependent LLM class oxidoreductase [Kribbella turkmenica]